MTLILASPTLIATPAVKQIELRLDVQFTSANTSNRSPDLSRNSLAASSGFNGNLNTPLMLLAANESSSQPNTIPETKREAVKPKRSFNDLMTSAHRYVEAEEWAKAKHELTLALQHNPKSTAAQELLETTNAELAKVQNRRSSAAFKAAVAAEDWVKANQLASDLNQPNSTQTIEIRRSNQLADIELSVDRLLANPSQMARPSAQREFKQITASLTNIDPGRRIAAKYQELASANQHWTTPVTIVVQSDRRTNVIIQPGQTLGKFREKRLKLMPGEYQLIGRRQGFHEVRHELVLQPGQEERTYQIRADMRF
ncbi:MAG: hypothetical protein F4W90_01315 [Gammaproteobacteria bacterium]|nr:hypothetical protein [Gammaproteobacteria bacterium]